jgi:hypothetical protein
LVKETFNNITSGFVSWNTTLRSHSFPSGSGLTAGITTSTTTLDNLYKQVGTYSGVSVDSGFASISGLIDTSLIENGLYQLRVEMTDYAGNLGVQIYYIYVVNPLQYVNLSIYDYENQVLAMNFSNTIVTSGTFSVSDLTLSIFRTSGNSTVSTQNLTITNLSAVNADGERVILVRVNATSTIDQFYFEPDDQISLTIGASGLDKLFNKVNEPILQPTASTRVFASWPDAPFLFRAGIINHSIINEYPYTASDFEYLSEYPVNIVGQYFNLLLDIEYGELTSGITQVEYIGSLRGGTDEILTNATHYDYDLESTRFTLKGTFFNLFGGAGLPTGDYTFEFTFNNGDIVSVTIKEYPVKAGGFYLE